MRLSWGLFFSMIAISCGIVFWFVGFYEIFPDLKERPSLTISLTTVMSLASSLGTYFVFVSFIDSRIKRNKEIIENDAINISRKIKKDRGNVVDIIQNYYEGKGVVNMDPMIYIIIAIVLAPGIFSVGLFFHWGAFALFRNGHLGIAIVLIIFFLSGSISSSYINDIRRIPEYSYTHAKILNNSRSFDGFKRKLKLKFLKNYKIDNLSKNELDKIFKPTPCIKERDFLNCRYSNKIVLSILFLFNIISILLFLFVCGILNVNDMKFFILLIVLGLALLAGLVFKFKILFHAIVIAVIIDVCFILMEMRYFIILRQVSFFLGFVALLTFLDLIASRSFAYWYFIKKLDNFLRAFMCPVIKLFPLFIIVYLILIKNPENSAVYSSYNYLCLASGMFVATLIAIGISGYFHYKEQARLMNEATFLQLGKNVEISDKIDKIFIYPLYHFVEVHQKEEKKVRDFAEDLQSEESYGYNGS